jgi:hypothetical protein
MRSPLDLVLPHTSANGKTQRGCTSISNIGASGEKLLHEATDEEERRTFNRIAVTKRFAPNRESASKEGRRGYRRTGSVKSPKEGATRESGNPRKRERKIGRRMGSSAPETLPMKNSNIGFYFFLLLSLPCETIVHCC